MLRFLLTKAGEPPAFELKSGCAGKEGAHLLVRAALPTVRTHGPLVSGHLFEGLVHAFPDRLGGFGCDLQPAPPVPSIVPIAFFELLTDLLLQSLS